MTFRVLGPHEHGRFAPEAWGYLLTLRGTTSLTSGEFELVVDRALSQVDGRIGLEEVQVLLDGMGVDDRHASSDTQTVH